mmetsp:Transcript_37011/g.48741  ORF Transcript_37011/g.48741 Transcript_37011/m.48741 type:complete len:80 (+) Transcript_37011:234-473(+)
MIHSRLSRASINHQKQEVDSQEQITRDSMQLLFTKIAHTHFQNILSSLELGQGLEVDLLIGNQQQSHQHVLPTQSVQAV